MRKRSHTFHRESHPLDAKVRASAPGRFVKLPDGMVHYALAGPSDAQTVVLVHGFSVPYFIWDPTFDALVEAGFRVLRYDLYGRGYSDRPDTTYDQDLFDRQLFDLLTALEIGPPADLVGLSMGGAICVVFADRHPELVRRLCLIDPAGLHWKQPLPVKLLAAPVLGEWIMQALGEKVLLSQFQLYLRDHPKVDEYARKFHDQMRYAGFQHALLSTLRSGVTTGAVEAYKHVGKGDIPVMLLWGREDRLVPFDLSVCVKEYIPGLEFHAIEDAAHTPHLERPEIVNPLLLEFLARDSHGQR